MTASAAESAERARPDLQLSRKGRPPRNSVDTTLLLLVTVVAATFGPYLVGGVRADQLLVYAAAVPASFAALYVRRPIFLRPVILAWLLLVLAVLVSTVTQTGNIDRSFVPARGIITGLDTVLFPLAIVLLVNMARPGSAARALHGVLTTIVVLMTANAGLAVLQIASPSSVGWLTRWHTLGIATETVASRAAGLGRVGGVFNQPAEAGLAYGCALLAAIFLWRARGRLAVLPILLIFVGGTLTVSKVFLLGVAAAILLALVIGRGVTRVLPLLLTLSAVVAVPLLSAVWSGASYWERYRDIPQEQWVKVFSSGRFGSESALTETVSLITWHDPITGFGAAGVLRAYDNAWVEAYALGGVLAVAALTLFMALAINVASSGRRSSLKAFFLALTLMYCVACAGVPAFTANRAGLYYWVIMGLILVGLRDQEAGGSPRRGA